MSAKRPGRRVTISDIAERAGVSIATVSFALNGRKGVSDETRERVRRVAADLNWAPGSAARSLAEARTDTYGLVLARDPHTLGMEPFYMRFLAGVEVELSRRAIGLLLQVVDSSEGELATLQRWQAARRVDGVLLVDVTVDDPRVAWCSRPDALPAVVVADPSVAGELTCVWTDDATSMRAAVAHLAELGHRRIARVAGIRAYAHTRIRDSAFLAATQQHGVEAQLLRTDYAPESGRRATRRALRSATPPSALIYDNDVMAVAALGVAAELGLRVPADVSIIAWDDSVLCEHTFPTLTALSHDVLGFGSHAARRLGDVIAGTGPSGHFLDSTPRLVVRDSTGPAGERRIRPRPKAADVTR